MSAIFGIIHLDGSPVPWERLQAMQQAMAYWGPDGVSLWNQDNAGLGHLLLHGTPEDEHEIQPQIDETDGWVMVSSARLDNRDDLLDELHIPNGEWPNLPDTGLVFRAFQKWGESCTAHLIGDWIAAIWNPALQRLWIGRDPSGGCGVYYFQSDRLLVFASSFKGLFAIPQIPCQPNPLKVAQVLVSWNESGPETTYQGIFRLPPAHTLVLSGHRVVIARYWYLENTPRLRLGSDEEYIETFLGIFKRAVSVRLRSPRPVGILLSGGLDSGSVASLAATELGMHSQRLSALSSVPLYDSLSNNPQNRYFDETPMIEATQRYFGNIDLHFIQSRDVTLVEGLQAALHLHGQPKLAASNTYWITSLLEEARTLGLGTLLTGQMGNASISWGTPTGAVLNFWRQGMWESGLNELSAEIRAVSLAQVLKRQFLAPARAAFRRTGMRLFRGNREPWARHSYINPALARQLDLLSQMLHAGFDPTSSLVVNSRKARLNILQPGHSMIGESWTQWGAGFGLEVRDPTMDYRLLEFCLAIPDDQYVRDGRTRQLVRRAMADRLPPEVLRNNRRGLQAADLRERMQADQTELRTTFERLKRSPLSRSYLDLTKMEAALTALLAEGSPATPGSNPVHFLRGFMVGLFLLQFEA